MQSKSTMEKQIVVFLRSLIHSVGLSLNTLFFTFLTFFTFHCLNVCFMIWTSRFLRKYLYIALHAFLVKDKIKCKSFKIDFLIYNIKSISLSSLYVELKRWFRKILILYISTHPRNSYKHQVQSWTKRIFLNGKMQ